MTEAQLPPEDQGTEQAPDLSDVPTGKTRRAVIDNPDFELNPMSMVGSWFHRVENGEMVWDGCVVGEPQAGKYLVELGPTNLEGAMRRRVQVLVTLDQMLAKDEGYEYRFYDSESEMRDAYAEYAVREDVRG